MPDNIALIGAGIMGSAIAMRLLTCAHRVTAFDIDQAKCEALAAKGAATAASPAEATAKANFVILSLNHADIVGAAVFGEGGVAASATPEKLLIDMSSIDPGATARMASELTAATGMRWLDAPLSGGVPGALSGTLTVMAGGTEADFTHARAVMSDLAANFTLMGAVGAGQTTKLVNQLLCVIAFEAVAEAVKLAEAGGVDPAKIPAALAGGRADSRILQEFMAKFAARDFTPTGRLDNMLKDLDSVMAFALATRTPLPLASAVTELHRILIAAGLGPADSAEAMRLLDGKLQR